MAGYSWSSFPIHHHGHGHGRRSINWHRWAVGLCVRGPPFIWRNVLIVIIDLHFVVYIYKQIVCSLFCDGICWSVCRERSLHQSIWFCTKISEIFRIGEETSYAILVLVIPLPNWRVQLGGWRSCKVWRSGSEVGLSGMSRGLFRCNIRPGRGGCMVLAKRLMNIVTVAHKWVLYARERLGWHIGWRAEMGFASSWRAISALPIWPEMWVGTVFCASRLGRLPPRGICPLPGAGSSPVNPPLDVWCVLWRCWQASQAIGGVAHFYDSVTKKGLIGAVNFSLPFPYQLSETACRSCVP